MATNMVGELRTTLPLSPVYISMSTIVEVDIQNIDTIIKLLYVK